MGITYEPIKDLAIGILLEGNLSIFNSFEYDQQYSVSDYEAFIDPSPMLSRIQPIVPWILPSRFFGRSEGSLTGSRELNHGEYFNDQGADSEVKDFFCNQWSRSFYGTREDEEVLKELVMSSRTPCRRKGSTAR